jgi:signal transduction histidine kinase
MLLREGLIADNSNNNVDGRSTERNELVYGEENVVNEELQFLSSSKIRIDTCMDNSRPTLATGIESIKNSFLEAKRRGVELRYLTEITEHNISSCKKLMLIVDEVRHVDGLKGNFMVSEKEYLAPASPSDKTKPASRLFYSNLKDIVEQHQYLFQVLWNRSITTEERIKEIEEGIMPVRTKILEDQEEIVNEIKRKNNAANKLSICCGFGGMQMSYNFLFDSYKKVIAKYRKGGCSGMRWITNIDKGGVALVKTFLQAGIRIRHIKNMPPLNFGVSDKEVAITIEKMEEGKMSQSFLISNEPLYTIHFNSVFDELWKDGIDAEDRIRDIEVGAEWANVEVIPMSSKARDLYLNLVKKAEEEIIIMFPTTNAFIRQKNLGVIESLEEAARERNVKVRILMPLHKSTEGIAEHLKGSYIECIDVRYLEKMSDTKATILVVDRKVSLVMELRDDSKDTFDEAIGLSTYSNSRPGVLSYVSIFDNLWDQTKLYEQIKDSNTKLELANTQLQIQDKAQQEFINIAAHELRTPIQPILGLSGLLLQDKQTEKKRQELLEVVFRNAKRLERLTENILDITRIESKSLKLDKEVFNLSEMLRDAAADFQNQIDREKVVSDSRKLELIGLEEDILVEADKDRIHQVISNLLSNAIKFTDEGKVIISATKFDDEVVVKVKDTGSGIDSKILPKLFTKFATKSVSGTGLGLFISKNIIEAHGGQLCGQNNANEKGATFSFSLPSKVEDSKK